MAYMDIGRHDETHQHRVTLWHAEEFKPRECLIDCFSNDLDGTYYGSIFDATSGEILGDYWTDDGKWIQDTFPNHRF